MFESRGSVELVVCPCPTVPGFGGLVGAGETDGAEGFVGPVVGVFWAHAELSKIANIADAKVISTSSVEPD
jgi:hypothetical protein